MKGETIMSDMEKDKKKGREAFCGLRNEWKLLSKLSFSELVWQTILMILAVLLAAGTFNLFDLLITDVIRLFL